jgi:exopolyphosphatase / guanosine-5'-triphosphate,3'-diphosphate pyrophosphatase
VRIDPIAAFRPKKAENASARVPAHAVSLLEPQAAGMLSFLRQSNSVFLGCCMEEKQFFLSPELAYRLAAIDIGTNSIRLIVAEPLRGGSYRILDEEKESTRLGEQLSKTRRLDQRSIEKSLAALRRMKQIAEGFQITELRTIATCAVREATNGDEFCRRAREELGINIEIIGAQQEALLAFASVQRAFDIQNQHVAVVDIGGGSTEIVLAFGNHVEAVYTTQLGAVRLSEVYADTASPEGFQNLLDGIDRHLRKHTKNRVFVPHILFGSGGTFTSMATMMMASKGQSGMPVRGYQVSRAEVRHLLERLCKTPLKDRAGVPGLSPDRADIIVAGLAIIDRIMDRFEVNVVQVHNRGVRDGLLLSMIDSSLGTHERPHDREAAIERLATSCGCELAHSRHVAALAASIYRQMAAEFGLNPLDCGLLEAAARLQDVGYLINYDQHHKHSYHLILHSRLEGFQPHELELVANVARYHRGANPKRKHANFRQLTEADQLRVRQMAAILRLAGGLDRSNTQQVTSVHVERPRKGETVLRAAAKSFPEVDVWGARKRGDLFEKVFDTDLRIEWDQAADEQSTSGAAEGNGSATAMRDRRSSGSH